MALQAVSLQQSDCVISTCVAVCSWTVSMHYGMDHCQGGRRRPAVCQRFILVSLSRLLLIILCLVLFVFLFSSLTENIKTNCLYIIKLLDLTVCLFDCDKQCRVLCVSAILARAICWPYIRCLGALIHSAFLAFMLLRPRRWPDDSATRTQPVISEHVTTYQQSAWNTALLRECSMTDLRVFCIMSYDAIIFCKKI